MGERDRAREAKWVGADDKVLACDFCGWQGYAARADSELINEEGASELWSLDCPNCGMPLDVAEHDPREPSEWSSPGPWPTSPVASRAKRSREAPRPKPNDPTDEALAYEVNTGFLDPYRGNISTPEGWGPTRGQPAPRLKKKDKAPVMPADLQYYARRRTAMAKRKAVESQRKELIALARDLEQGAGEDIWYDAADYGDGLAAWRIERTKEAMLEAASALRRMAAEAKGGR